MALKTVYGGLVVNIDVGDWVRVNEAAGLEPDPDNNNLYQVTSLPENQSYCLVNSIVTGTTEYAETGLALEFIEKVYKLTPFES